MRGTVGDAGKYALPFLSVPFHDAPVFTAMFGEHIFAT
jgi:hypothetical protein